MYPIDALTASDKTQMINWIEDTQGFEPQTSIDNILRFWNKNKIRLFKMFGNKLRIEMPLTLERPELCVQRKDMVKVLKEHKIFATYTDAFLGDKDDSYFPNNLARFMYDNYYYNMRSYSIIITYNYLLKEIDSSYAIKSVISGKLVCAQKFEVGGKEYYLPEGMKYTKAVKAFCQAIGFKLDNTFEEWRNRYSDFRTLRSNPEKMKMVFSIHPFDYMTMSDGGDWSTCMSWRTNGCYSASTLEMMGSNNVIMCYATPANDNSNFQKKVWRSLVVVDKDIIVTGKSYPYHNDEMSRFILNKITEMAASKFNWKYQYKNQLYRDLSRYKGQGENSLRHSRTREGYPGNRIVIYTNGFYNDWFQDLDEPYWCNRNYVSKTKGVCVSGPAPCLFCGEKIDKPKPSDMSYAEFFTASNIKLCDECYSNHICEDCGSVTDKIINVLRLQYREKQSGFCPASEEVGLFSFQDENVCVKCATDYLHAKEYGYCLVIIYDNEGKTDKIFLDKNEAEEYTINNQKNISRIVFFYRCGYSAEKNYELYQKEGKDCLKQYPFRSV